MITLEDRILLHLQDGKRIPVDPQGVYLLEAEGGEIAGPLGPGFGARLLEGREVAAVLQLQGIERTGHHPRGAGEYRD
jgi:hypothetical protein